MFMSLVRPARLQSFYRHLSVSSITQARGDSPRPVRDKARPARHESNEEFTDETYQPVQPSIRDRLKATARSNFDMQRFTQKVRGERRVISEEKQLNADSQPKASPENPKSRNAEDWRTESTAKYDAFGWEVDTEASEDVSTMSTDNGSFSRSSEQKPVRDREDRPKTNQSRAGPVSPVGAKKNALGTQSTASRFPYLEDKDPLFKKVLMDIKNRSQREKSKKILLEGHRLINEALLNGVRVTTVFFSHADQLNLLDLNTLRLMKAVIYQVSPKQMGLWSDMTTPPGVMAVSVMPNPTVMDSTRNMSLTVVLDNIRDPGNMGAIVRVLAGAACSEILCMKGCVDPWDPKVLRAAMGAHFHVPIQYNIDWEVINNYLPNPATVYLADNLEEKAAGAHLDMSRTRGIRLFPRRRPFKLDVTPFHHVDYREGSIVFIIGGETSGVSMEAYNATAERRGKKLVIPLGNYVESLNAASVVAVLAFEMRRQRLLLDGDVAPNEATEDEISEQESDSEESAGKLP